MQSADAIIALAEESNFFTKTALEPTLAAACKAMDDDCIGCRAAFARAVGCLMAVSVEGQQLGGNSGSGRDRTSSADASSETKKNPSVTRQSSLTSFGRKKSQKILSFDLHSGMQYLKVQWDMRGTRGGKATVALALSCFLRVLVAKELIFFSSVAVVVSNLLALLQSGSGGASGTAAEFDRVSHRAAVNFIFRSFSTMIDDHLQRELSMCLVQSLSSGQEVSDSRNGSSSGSAGKNGGGSSSIYQQQMCCITELSHLVSQLGEMAPAFIVGVDYGHSDRVSDGEDQASRPNGVRVLLGLLKHQQHDVRYEAAIAISAMASKNPSMLAPLLTSLLDSIREDHSMLLGAAESIAIQSSSTSSSKNSQNQQSQRDILRGLMFPLHGHSATTALLVQSLKTGSNLEMYGSPNAVPDLVLQCGEALVMTQFDDRLSSGVRLTCVRAGWNLITALVGIGEKVVKPKLATLLRLWQASLVLISPGTSSRSQDPTHELVRIEAAMIALQAFIKSCPNLVSSSMTFEEDLDLSEDDPGGASTSFRVSLLLSGILGTLLPLALSGGVLSSPKKKRGVETLFRLLATILEIFTVLPGLDIDVTSSRLGAASSSKSAAPIASLLDLAVRHVAEDPRTGLSCSTSFLSMLLNAEDSVLQVQL
jgi:hypothetical protein